MLVDLANERGSSDNITVTLLEWATEAETAPQLVVSADAVAPEQMPSYGYGSTRFSGTGTVYLDFAHLVGIACMIVARNTPGK